MLIIKLNVLTLCILVRTFIFFTTESILKEILYFGAILFLAQLFSAFPDVFLSEQMISMKSLKVSPAGPQINHVVFCQLSPRDRRSYCLLSEREMLRVLNFLLFKCESFQKIQNHPDFKSS